MTITGCIDTCLNSFLWPGCAALISVPLAVPIIIAGCAVYVEIRLKLNIERYYRPPVIKLIAFSDTVKIIGLCAKIIFSDRQHCIEIYIA